MRTDPDPLRDNVAVWIKEGAHHLDLMFRFYFLFGLQWAVGWVGGALCRRVRGATLTPRELLEPAVFCCACCLLRGS